MQPRCPNATWRTSSGQAGWKRLPPAASAEELRAERCGRKPLSEPRDYLARSFQQVVPDVVPPRGEDATREQALRS
eukprot:8602299-Alexandrium_andersonii.AAC.1